MKARQESLTQADLNRWFDYDPSTGIVARRLSMGNRKTGSVVGTRHRTGYLTVEIGDREYQLHRVIWCMTTGEWPIEQIDHADNDKENNKLYNLREATNGQNTNNQRLRKTSKSGLKGVSFYTIPKKFKASIRKNGRDIHLGFFDCPAAASFAYQIAADKLFGRFSRLF